MIEKIRLITREDPHYGQLAGLCALAELYWIRFIQQNQYHLCYHPIIINGSWSNVIQKVDRYDPAKLFGKPTFFVVNSEDPTLTHYIFVGGEGSYYGRPFDPEQLSISYRHYALPLRKATLADQANKEFVRQHPQEKAQDIYQQFIQNL